MVAHAVGYNDVMDVDELAIEISAAAQRSGEFRLRSGLVADTYFDKYQFESDPRLLQAVAARMVELVPSDTQMLAGLELGGVPVATALSLTTGLPVVFVRKKAKEYGTAKLAEGPSIDGRRLLIVEDVVTTAGQVVVSTNDLRHRGAIVEHAICVIDREQGGSEALRDVGLELASVFTRGELDVAHADR